MLSNILTNAERVSLFPNRECRKFIRKGIGRHLAASYPYTADIGVGVDAYFIPEGNPTTCDSEIGFRHHAFFVFTTAGVRAEEKTLIMKKLLLLFLTLFIFLTSDAQVYKFYQTNNIHNQLKLNTKTGEIYQVQDDGQVFLVCSAVTPDNDKSNRYSLFKTQNIWTFILWTDLRESCGNANIV